MANSVNRMGSKVDEVKQSSQQSEASLCSVIEQAVRNSVKSEMENYKHLMIPSFRFNRAIGQASPPAVVENSSLELPTLAGMSDKLQNVWLLYVQGYGKFRVGLKDLSKEEIVDIKRGPDGKQVGAKRLLYSKIMTLVDLIKARSLETGEPELETAIKWDLEKGLRKLNNIVEPNKRSHKRKEDDRDE